MKKICSLFFISLVAGCVFHPLYSAKTYKNVCVQSIPEASGFVVYQTLKNYFPDEDQCHYTLQVQAPKIVLSDQGISDKSFTTMQRVSASCDYKLLDTKKKVVLQKSAKTLGSSAIVLDPYASVVAEESVENDLYVILANQIALHISSFLDKETK